MRLHSLSKKRFTGSQHQVRLLSTTNYQRRNTERYSDSKYSKFSVKYFKGCLNNSFSRVGEHQAITHIVAFIDHKEWTLPENSCYDKVNFL